MQSYSYRQGPSIHLETPVAVFIESHFLTTSFTVNSSQQPDQLISLYRVSQ